MEFKRCKFDCGLYPLCITTKDQNFGCSNNGEISFERDTSIARLELKVEPKLHVMLLQIHI